MLLSGIYIIKLKNFNEKKPVDTDVRRQNVLKVDSNAIKVGKAKNLNNRKKNYIKTFGLENVDFKILYECNFDQLKNIENKILHKIDKYRIINPKTNRKTEWLNGNYTDIETIILELL